MRRLLSALSWKVSAVLVFALLCGCNTDTIRDATAGQLKSSLNALIGDLAEQLVYNLLGLPR